MKILLILILPVFFLSSQQEPRYTVKFKCIMNGEPLVGATLSIPENDPHYKAFTDLNGLAELEINTAKAVIGLYYLDPYVTLSIEQPVDSVFIDLTRKKAELYYQNKKKKTRKLRVHS